MSNRVKIFSVLSVIIMITIISMTVIGSGVIIYNPAPNMTATIINEVKAYDTEYI